MIYTETTKKAMIISFRAHKDQKDKSGLLLNGCDSECAARSEIIRNIVIDHNNWEKAEEVFAAEINKLG